MLAATGAIDTIRYSKIEDVTHADPDISALLPLLTDKDLLANSVETIELQKSGLCLLRLINATKVGVNRTLWIDLPSFKNLLETEVEKKDRKEALQVGLMVTLFIFVVIRNL